MFEPEHVASPYPFVTKPDEHAIERCRGPSAVEHSSGVYRWVARFGIAPPSAVSTSSDRRGVHCDVRGHLTIVLV